MQVFDFSREAAQLLLIKNELAPLVYGERLEELVKLYLNKQVAEKNMPWITTGVCDLVLGWLPEMVVVCSMGGKVIYVNEATKSAFNKNEAQLLSTDVRLLFPARLRDWVVDVFENIDAVDGYRTDGFIQTSPDTETAVSISGNRIAFAGDWLVCLSFRLPQEKQTTSIPKSNPEQILQETHAIAQMGFSEWRMATNSFYWSSETYRIYDWDERVTLPTLETVSLHVHPDDVENFFVMHNLLLNSNNPVRFEYRITTPGGKIKWLLYAGQKLTLTDGAVVIRGMVMDSTKERLAKPAVQNAEQTLQLLTKNSSDALLILNSEMECVYCSPSIKKMLDINEADLYNKSFVQFLQEENKASFYQLLDKQQPYAEKIELIFTKPNGSTCWVECSLTDHESTQLEKGSFCLLLHDVSEKHRASDFLQLASDIFNNIQTGFFIYKAENLNDDSSLQLIAANPAAERLTGVKANEIIGKFIDDIFPNLRPKGITELFMEVVRSGKSFEMTDFEYTDRRVVQTAYAFKAFPLPNHQLGVSFENITEQKHIQQQLIDSEGRFKTYIENSPVSIFIVNAKGYCTFANKAASEMLHYDQTVLEGIQISSIIWHNDLDDEQNIMSLLEKNQLSEKIDLRTSENKRLTTRLTAIELADKQWLAICTDLTELQQAKADMQRIYDLSLNLICVVNTNNMLLRMNPAFEKVLGFSFEEMTVVPFTTFIHPDDKAANVEQLRKQIQQKCGTERYENRFICKNGGYKWLSWSVQYDETENLLFGIGHDITAMKDAEQELLVAKERAEQSDRLKSAFLANMSHEIRTPMNGILGFARLLNQDTISSDQRSKYVNIINKSSNQLLTIISDIIDISKIEAGLLQISEKQIGLNAVMEELNAQFLLELKNVNKSHLELTMSLGLPNGQDVFVTDEVRLKQLMINLLNNAIKFTKLGTITFGYMLTKEGTIQFFVEDTGVGIQSDRLQSVFERFMQIEQYSNKASGGTGLGLAISRGIVELLGGKIDVDSNYGIGSRFFIDLPYNLPLVAEPKRTTPQMVITPQTNWSNKTILIVDDMEVIHEFFNEVLVTTQAKIIRVKRGKDAVNIFSKKHDEISVVLLDIQLPDINGSAVAQLMRSINPNVPLIAQTAFAQSGDRETYINEGFQDYLSKPINIENLIAILSRYLNKP